MASERKVFLSVGRTEDSQQKLFVDEIEKILKIAGLEPRRAGYSSVQPLKKIQEELGQCDAAVIIAFERLYADSAFEFKSTPKERVVQPLKTTTVWNHIEAAMAYSSGLPILTIAQNGCRNDGMLDAVSEWKVCWIDFEKGELNSDRFRTIFSDWRQRIDLKPAPGKRVDLDRVSEMKISEILGSLRIDQIVGLLGSAAALFAAGAAAGAFFHFS